VRCIFRAHTCWQWEAASPLQADLSGSGASARRIILRFYHFFSHEDLTGLKLSANEAPVAFTPNRRKKPAAGVFPPALLIGLSRIFIGAHYPSDVVIGGVLVLGAVIGHVVALAMVFLVF
jgi:membrane-associated phospholipid phosphatase